MFLRLQNKSALQKKELIEDAVNTSWFGVQQSTQFTWNDWISTNVNSWLSSQYKLWRQIWIYQSLETASHSQTEILQVKSLTLQKIIVIKTGLFNYTNFPGSNVKFLYSLPESSFDKRHRAPLLKNWQSHHFTNCMTRNNLPLLQPFTEDLVFLHFSISSSHVLD